MQRFIYLLFLLLNCFATYAQINQPRLIVQLVVDQLRGDLIQHHQHQFGSDGFNYLLNHGIDYHNAHHPHANTITCVGHATIATGSIPSLHGIISNAWYDRSAQQMVYCTEDLTTKIIPTQHTRIVTPGRSPKYLYASTLSDELVLAHKGRAFSISFKDRAAITLAGHAGKAFWFDTTNGGFITSNYYYKQYPQWVTLWNKNYQSQDFDWNLMHPKAEYQNAKAPIWEQKDKLFGDIFPHHVSQAPNPAYFKLLSKTPKADQLTANFAEHLLTEEQLGLSLNKTDYMAISFSAVDAIGHHFGPNSLETEDNLLVLDKTLAHLFKVIDQRVGLNNTLIVLTADHGINDSPTSLQEHHMGKAQPINLLEMEQFIHTLLKKHYQLPPETLAAIALPFIYLDDRLIEQHQLNLAKVTHYLAQELTRKPGLFKAYSLPIIQIEKDWLSAKVNKMFFPNRSGDIYIVQPPNEINGAKDIERVAHGSPWKYDSYVPLLFSHPSFKSQRIFRPVFTTDIAPTLASLLLIKAPSATVGQPLTEVIQQEFPSANRFSPTNSRNQGNTMG